MSGQAYQGSAKRTFKQALVRLLEQDYSLLGSGRILQLLAEDVEALSETFFPLADHIRPGWMLFTAVKAEGGKAYPGRKASDYQLVTIAWPVCLPEDIQTLADAPSGSVGRRVRQQLLVQRATRLVQHGWQHARGPLVLTLADLSLMLGVDTVRVSALLKQARLETGLPLTTMGYHFDLGMKPTHKAEIIALYEQGLDETEIALRSQHAQSSVGRYLRDYERVKLSLTNAIPVEEIPLLINLQAAVVAAYLDLIEKYHPDLRIKSGNIESKT